ncbi:MAG: SusC/RagA family TonB-linked outer membrane protein [Chitinophagaceae bacterium]|nr:SusC/RagA family TonB-linked outer membrane protein [Chitinophagaceae bacterium]
MRKLAMLFFCLMVSFLSVFGQNRVIKGTVLDAEGKPVSGASVFAKGAKSGAITGKDGSFALQLSESVKAIEITSLGFERKEIIIGTNSTFNISLEKKFDPLDEVIVTGYQVRKKRDEAGAISSVRGKDIENLPNLSVDKALQGKAAGVLVQANNGIPGGAINVRIRGQGSYLAGNDPLYIVDGVQFNTRIDGAYTQNNPLAFLNPDDIESIDVLKDAATASIYGSNASNGVVLITTKKGKAGKTKFNVNVNNGIAQPLKTFQMVNAQDYFRLRAEAYGNANNLPWDNINVLLTVLNELRVPIGSITTVDQAKAAAAALTTYDWQGASFKNGTLGTYEVSASGGNEKTTFRVSGNVTTQDAIVTKANFARQGLKLDIQNRATDRLSFGGSISLSTFLQNSPFAVSGSFLGSPAFSASGIIPTNPIYNPDGSYYGIPGGTPANLVGVLNQNIVAVNDFNSGFQRTNQIVGNLNADYKIFSWLTFRTQVGLDYRLVQGKIVRDARTPDGFGVKGNVFVQSNWNTNINTFQTLNFNKTFGTKHKLDGVAGFEYRRENNEQINANGNTFPTYQFTSLNNAANPVSVGEFFSGFRRNGIFARVNYGYDGKYLLSLTGRRDGSSRFGADNRFGYFWGILGAWNIDKENFLANSKVISALKLRASYGSTGNDQIGNFDGLGLYGGGGIYNGSSGIAYTQLANTNLQWERNITTNFGVDFGLFDNRVTGTVEVYSKDSRDVLLSQPLQSTTGFTSITSNIGKLNNRGIEVTLGADIFKAKKQGDLNWNTSFTFAYNKNEVKELYGGLQILPGDNSVQVGQPLGVLFTQQFAGVNPATGRSMWYDSSGNLTYQVTAKDRRIIGPQNLPKFQGGWRNTVSFRNITIEWFFNYEYGRYVSDGQVNFLTENIGRINVLQTVFDNRWTTPGQVTFFPRYNVNGTEAKASGSQSGTRNFFKADYIRLKNVSAYYDFPQAVIKKAKLTSLRVYMQGTNLWTKSDWFSYDVEFVGTATGIIPQSTNYTFGVQVGF